MEKFMCGRAYGENFQNDFLECGGCGNHVCREQAKKSHGVCPHCFGKLYFIN